jgi:hypothetical protein
MCGGGRYLSLKVKESFTISMLVIISIAMKPAFTAALSEGEVFRRLLGKETDVRLFELPTGELKGRRESPFMMEVFYNSVFEGKFFPSNRVRSKPLQLI